MKKIFLALALVFSLILTGCLNGDETATGEGLEISFSSVRDTYIVDHSEETPEATFNAHVKNRGRAHAILKSLKLEGPAWISSENRYFEVEDRLGTGATVTVDINKWHDWRDDIHSHIWEVTLEAVLDALYDGEALSEREEYVANLILEGRDPTRDFTGDERYFSHDVPIDVTERDLRAGESINYDVTLEAIYHHYNTGNADFTIYPEHEYIDRDLSPGTATITDQMEGPVNIEVKNMPRHVSASQRTLQPTIVIENVGTGDFAKMDGERYLYGQHGFFPTRSIYPTEVYVPGDWAEVQRCELIDDREFITFRGRDRLEFTCPIRIQEDEIDSIEYPSLRVSAVYDYVERLDTQVELVGR